MTTGSTIAALLFAAVMIVILVSFFAVRLDQNEKDAAQAAAEAAAAFVPADVPLEQFQAAAQAACTNMKGLSDFRISGTIVHGHCPCRSGEGLWAFDLQFDDGGQITGRYMKYSENSRSALPDYIGHLIQESLEADFQIQNVVFKHSESGDPFPDPPTPQPSSFLMSLAAVIVFLLFLFVCTLFIR